MSTKYLVLLVLIYLSAVKSEEPSWDYEDTSKWGESYEKCNGKMQSPINIDPSRATLSPLFSTPLKFNNYDIPLEEVLLHNNGNGVGAQIPKTVTGERPSISGGPFKKDYKLEAQYFQFHWRYRDQSGTEHFLDYGFDTIEMQIVHRNPDSNLSVVLGIFLDMSPFPGNSLDMINEILPKVTTYGSNATIDNNFKLGDLLDGINTDKFYSYEGSLTTPPCSYALWYIFRGYIDISEDLAENFWQILDKNNNTFSNSRPEFFAGKREIYKSYKI